MAYHGYPRATVDMDIWIGRDPETAEKMVEVLREFGFDTPNLSAALFLKALHGFVWVSPEIPSG